MLIAVIFASYISVGFVVYSLLMKFAKDFMAGCDTLWYVITTTFLWPLAVTFFIINYIKNNEPFDQAVKTYVNWLRGENK